MDYIDESHIFSLKMVKYYKREVFIVQKYKKYLVNSRKSRNFAPQFVKRLCFRTHFPVCMRIFILIFNHLK